MYRKTAALLDLSSHHTVNTSYVLFDEKTGQILNIQKSLIITNTKQ